MERDGEERDEEHGAPAWAAAARAAGALDEQTRLLFTRSVIRTYCALAVGEDGARRRHDAFASPGIVPRPRLGEIWLGCTAVTSSLVKANPA